jgi:hypothetical protein
MKFLTTITILFLTSWNFAQTMNENLGAVSCEFTFLTIGDTMNTTKQHLILRTEKKSEYTGNHHGSYGSGLAYSEWYLEFISTTSIRDRQKYIKEKLRCRRKYYVVFRDVNSAILLTNYVKKDAIKNWIGGSIGEPVNIYSLDLLNIPLVILEDVKFIDVVYIR